MSAPSMEEPHPIPGMEIRRTHQTCRRNTTRNKFAALAVEERLVQLREEADFGFSFDEDNLLERTAPSFSLPIPKARKRVSFARHPIIIPRVRFARKVEYIEPRAVLYDPGSAPDNSEFCRFFHSHADLFRAMKNEPLYKQLQASQAKPFDSQLKVYADGSWEPVAKDLRDEVEFEELVAANTTANKGGCLKRKHRVMELGAMQTNVDRYAHFDLIKSVMKKMERVKMLQFRPDVEVKLFSAAEPGFTDQGKSELEKLSDEPKKKLKKRRRL